MVFEGVKIVKSNFFSFLIDKLSAFYSKYCKKIKNPYLMGFILEN